MQEHTTVTDAAKTAAAALTRAVSRRKFMVTVWSIDERGDLLIDKTSWDFPRGRFQEAAEIQRELLESEKRQVPRPAMALPEADLSGLGLDIFVPAEEKAGPCDES